MTVVSDSACASCRPISLGVKFWVEQTCDDHTASSSQSKSPPLAPTNSQDIGETDLFYRFVLLVVVAFAGVGCSEGNKSPQGVQSRPSQSGIRGLPLPDTDSLDASNITRPQRTEFASPPFLDMTVESGVDFTYVNGEESGHHAILESLGGGAGLLDYDQDGRWDLMIAGGGRFGDSNEILGVVPGCYRNLGGWGFASVVDPAHLDRAPFYSHGIATADYDNDGFPDVLVTGYGGLQFFRNQGDGTFTEVSETSGLTDSSWSSSAAWGDLNGDGNTDLYVTHYVNWSFENDPICRAGEDREVCPPRSFEPLSDSLYVSNGNGTFHNATDEAGLEPDGKGLGVIMADLDVDGSLDVYVCNDTVPNFLYQNDGDGHLINKALFSGTALSDAGVPEGSMGVDVGDFNRDGLPDIWIANYENESFGLYRNSGRLFFQHVSRSAGVTAMGGLFVGWGTSFIDFDLDGDEDLVATNGHVIRHPVNAPLLQRPLLLENVNGRSFVDVTDQAGGYFQESHMGRGLVVGDLDMDGDNDVIVTHTNAPVALLSNDLTSESSWIGFRLIGTLSNRNSIGAVIRVRPSDGIEQVKQVTNGGSYASTSASNRIFGLGDSQDVRDVEIRWPSGFEMKLTAPKINQYITLVEPIVP